MPLEKVLVSLVLLCLGVRVVNNELKPKNYMMQQHPMKRWGLILVVLKLRESLLMKRSLISRCIA